MRHQGAGQLLSRVMESPTLDALALDGGLSVIVALVELAFSAWVLGIGAGECCTLAVSPMSLSV